MSLSNGDVVVFRERTSNLFLQAGQDSDANTAVARLIERNIITLQPSLHFKLITTPVPGFWVIQTTSAKYLKVGDNKLTWVDLDPSSPLVIDKSPYYFSFTHVAGTSTPSFYVFGSFYNQGVTLQQPGGPNTDLVFNIAQTQPGTEPELAFEIGIVSGSSSMSSIGLNQVGNVGNLRPQQLVATSATLAGDSSSSTTVMDPWAIAFVVFVSVVALIVLGYALYLGIKNQLEKRKQPKQTEEETEKKEETKTDEKEKTEESKKEKAGTASSMSSVTQKPAWDKIVFTKYRP